MGNVVTLEVADVSVTVDEDGKAEVALEATASEGTPEIVIDTQPAHGKLTGSGLAYSYVPEADYSGADSIAFTAKVGDVEKQGRVTITVTPINDAPAYAAGSDVSVLEDSGAYSTQWATAIVVGPEDEGEQQPTFTITNTNAALFAVAPAIAADGTLTFTPAANANGSATVTVNLEDDGGTASGGINTAPEATFTITVTPVNDRPNFTPGSAVVVAEDSAASSHTAWATSISAGPSDEAGQTYSFAVTTDQPGLFSVAPALANDGTLSFEPAADANGAATLYMTLTDNGGTANTGIATSVVKTATITVTAVNDRPTFTAGSNVSVNEDSGNYSGTWATNVAKGPINEAAQAVTFGVSVSNPGLFSAQPAIDAVGSLTFTPEANANGSAIVTVTAYDNGGTAGGGINASTSANFTLTVSAVNDAPSFVDAGNPVVAEDSGAASIASWASSISVGPNESQTYSFSVTTNAPALFAVAPAVSNAGTLSFTPAADSFGSAKIYVRLQDNGGTASGGVDMSSVHVATITISEKNDAPSFTKGANVTVDEDSGAYSAAWATAIAKGPVNEASQAVTFSVTTAQSSLFAVQPAVASNGTLSFTPAANANGTATLDVRIYDDGGTAGGGVDTSAAQSFTITINAVNDQPAFNTAALAPVAEDSGAASIAGFASGMSVGPADEVSQTYSFTVTTATPAAFAAAPALSNVGTLTFTPAANAYGVVALYIVMTDSAGASSAKAKVDLTISAVNDPPSFVKGGNQVGSEDGAPVVDADWATAVSPGAGESEAVAFVVSNDNPTLFSTAPTVSASGKLSYATAPDAYGVANVSVRLKDASGSLTAAQNFSINIVGVNDAPSFVAGGNQTVDEDAGQKTFAGWATGRTAGPANESWQTFSFAVSTSNPGLFAAGPAVNAAGDLSFTSATDANGTAVVYVRIQDNGGTSLGGQNTSAVQSFNITVNSVNDNPTFTDGGDRFVLETAGAQSYTNWASNMAVGPQDEVDAGQTYWFEVTNDASVGVFSVAPAVSLTGELTFTPASAGTANVAVTLHDSAGGSSLHTIRIVVDATNDAPSFVTGGTVAVLEDSGSYSSAWATSISAGPGETGQQLTFVVTGNTNPGLFSTQPAVAADGTLSFTPAADANGAAYVTVHLADDGGAVSADEVFKIEIAPVNDKPGFNVAGDVNAFEDDGLVVISAWAFGYAMGAPDESAQNLSFIVTADDPSLFSVAPQVDSLGNLSFTTAPDAVGFSQVEIKAVDDGGTAGGGVDTSSPIVVTISLDPVNDAPTFTSGGDVTIDEDDPTGLGHGMFWATDISVGPVDEVMQWYSFDATTDNNTLVNFIGLNPNGSLYFQTNRDESGTAIIYVTLYDNGGTANGGADFSVQTFTLTVNPVNDPPHTSPDAVATAMDTSSSWFGVLFNDWDPEGGPLSVTGYTQPAHGTLLTGLGFFQYTPAAGYTGADSFTYWASDGTLATPATVSLWVGPDTTPPAFVAGSSNPQNGATLNIEQAMGAGINGVPQIAPARFVFDDPFLDVMALDVAVTWDSQTLWEGSSFWVDRSQNGEITVYSDVYSHPSPPEGATLTFTLSDIKDTNGNTAPLPVAVSVWYDGKAPEPDWLTSSWGPYVRLVVQFDEPMEPSSVASFTAEDTTEGMPIAPDAENGSAMFSLDKANDAFYFVAGEPVPEGNDVTVDLSGFTDLAGNPAQGSTVWNYTVCCNNQPADVNLVAIRFVDRNTSAITASFAPGDLTLGSFLAPASIAGSDDLLQMVFDRTLDPSAGYADLRGEEMKPNSPRASGVYKTTNVSNDTVEFDLTTEVPGFTWHPWEAFELSAYLHTPASASSWGSGYMSEHRFVVRTGSSDVTAPTLSSFAARRGVGNVPVLRGEETLKVRFSEPIDPSTVTPANVALTGPGGNVPLLIEFDNGLSGLRLRAAGTDGKPGAWPTGNLTLSIANLKDASSSAHTIAAGQYAVAVTPAARPAPSLLHFSGANTVVTSPDLIFSFSDLMSPRSFVDAGPSAHGLKIEEKWGSVWVPLKGSRIRNDDRGEPTAVVRLDIGMNGPSAPGREYRLTWLPGLVNIDGVPLAAPEPITFVTGVQTPGNTAPQYSQMRLEAQDFPDSFSFGGPVPSRFDVQMDVWDQDPGDSWQLRLTSPAGSAVSNWSATPNLNVNLAGSQIDTVFPRGESTPFMITVSDAAGHAFSILQRLYRPSAALGTQGAPTVTLTGQPGVLTISGQVLDPVDAAAIAEMGAALLIVDTSVYPPAMVDVVGMYLGQVTRNGDGSITYTVSTPPDRPLPSLPPPLMYMAAGIAAVPFEIDMENRDIMTFTEMSAPFNP